MNPRPNHTASIADAVSVRPLPSAGSDVFSSTHPLWLPPTARGIYGGTFIAQSISAAQATISKDFVTHSIQSHFVHAGTADDKLLYHVERTRDGASFAARVVTCTQHKRTIFVAIVSLARSSTVTAPQLRQQHLSANYLAHGEPMPHDIPPPPTSPPAAALRGEYATQKIGISHGPAPAHDRRLYQWFRASQAVPSDDLGLQRAALAYICDNFLIQAAVHVNDVYDFVLPPQSEADVGGKQDLRAAGNEQLDPIPASSAQREVSGRRVAMMVSLSHTMYFHAAAGFRVEEWMLARLSSPWSGSGRGLARQEIWSRDGELLATAYQEGVIRMVPGGGLDHKSRSRL